MKIHFFVRTLNDKNGGGSHYNSIAYMRALRGAGHTVVVHVFSASSGNAFPADIEPIVHEGWGMSFARGRKYLAGLLRQYESDADVYFLYAVEFAWGGGHYRRMGGRVPVCVYMDAYLPSMNNVHLGSIGDYLYHFKRLPWDKTVGLKDAAHVDRFLPCSPYIGDEYKKFGFPKDSFTVLPNIVADKSAPKEITAKDAPVRVLYIGRLIYDKGIDLLLEALSRLRHIPANLIIVGDGPMRGFVEDIVNKENLAVEMIGWVPQQEVGKYYAQSDIFVHPARWPDPAPRTIVDALYSGLPVLVPDTGGSSWIAGNAGLVFKTGDTKTLTAQLERLLTNRDLIRSTLTVHAAGEARKFAESAVYPQLEKILFEIAAISKK